MLQRLQDAIARSRAGYTDIRCERVTLAAVAWRGRRLEGATTGTDTGGRVRCLYRGHGWGIATFSNLDELDAAVTRAGEMSLAARPPQPVVLAEVPVYRSERGKGNGEEDDTPLSPFPVLLSPDVASLAEKQRYVEHLNGEMLRFDRRVVSTLSAWRDEVVESWYATSEGTTMHDVRPDVTLTAVAIARDGGVLGRAADSIGAPGGWELMQDQDELFRSTARRAVSLLEARPVRSGTTTVIADPRLAGVVAHETVGHVAQAGVQLADPLAAELGRPGTRLGSAVITIGDDGSATGLRGSGAFDDEGTPTANTLLLQHGVMVGRLHTRESAARFGERPTGNARCGSWREVPTARLTNTYIQNGQGTFQDLLRDVKSGIYACDAVGARHLGVHHAFTAGHGYMIRDGELAELVKDIVLVGDLPDLLGAVDRVAGDFQWNETAASCRWDGQGSVPVCDGAPHVRFHGVDVRTGRS